MAATELLELVKEGDLDAFELKCIEAIESGQTPLGELARAFGQMAGETDPARVASLAQVVLDNLPAEADATAALAIARHALGADAENEALRKRTVELYERRYADEPAFEAFLQASGLATGRAARSAVRALDLCLALKVGDMLLSRTEDTVSEVVDIDPDTGAFTLRRAGRPRTVPAIELTREFDPVSADDFRVLRAQPQRLSELLERDPVKVVIGMIRSHGEMIDQDTLKHELVPDYLDAKRWSKWWTAARARLKKTPHVIMEGRSPVILRYSAEGQTLEDETWAAFEAQKEPEQWLSIIDAYLREKRKEKDDPQRALLERCHKFLMDYIEQVAARRPAEALACALVAERIDEQAGLVSEQSKRIAVDTLKQADNCVALIAPLKNDALWTLGIQALAASGRDDTAQCVVALLPAAPATALDDLVALASRCGALDGAQRTVDEALERPLERAEALYWLWRGPSAVEGLRLPARSEQFDLIVNTLSEVGRSVSADAGKVKNFRQRMKAALALRDFAAAQQCVAEAPPERAVTLRRQFDRLEGLGEVTRARLLDLLRAAHPDLWRAPRKRIEPWADPNVIWSTRAGLEKKLAERDQLVNVTMRENAQRIGEAAAMGDLSENSEYKFALEERDLLRARLAQMNQGISLATVIEPDGIPTDHVGVGSRVRLRRVGDGATREIAFLGPFDSDVDGGVFNYLAPLSQKLMGLRVGEQVPLTLDGTETPYEVIAITNSLQSAPSGGTANTAPAAH